jgi:hypothetical protein
VALIGAVGATAVVVAGTGGEEELVQQPASATATSATTTPTSGASPTVSPAASPTQAPTPEPSRAVPADWQTYEDPHLGFSVAYPPDLVFGDLSPSNPEPGINERAFEFQSPNDPRRGFTVAIASNIKSASLEAWVAEYGPCVPSTFTPGEVDGQPVLFCNSEPAGVRLKAVAFQQMGNLVLISSLLPASEFDLLAASLRGAWP